MVNQLKVGFSRIDITPPLGIYISGYYQDRYAEGVLDNLEINALAINKGDKTVVLVAVDTLQIVEDYINECKDVIKEKLGLSYEQIFIHSTHTHTGARLGIKNDNALEIEYNKNFKEKLLKCVESAISDLAPCKLGYGVNKAENVAFNRRYLMKDGSTKTNPGVNNPDIVKCIGLIDLDFTLVRFTREDGLNYVLLNFANHPDCVGGSKISSDWPGFTRRRVEKALDDVKCIFINGAQGDINHVNVAPKGGDFNDMFMDFDDVSRGYGHARHIGNVMAGCCLQLFDKVNYVDVDDIEYVIQNIDIPTNKATPEEMEEAYYIDKLHSEGKDDLLPYKGMLLTTMVAGAQRKIRLKDWPEFIQIPISAVRIGKIGLLGIPGEPFAAVGLGIKKSKGYDVILPCCLVNGSVGYFPMKDSYEEGGYEANTSQFKGGSAEIIVEESKKILENL